MIYIIMKSSIKTKKEHIDIKFLRMRLEQLIHIEEYETCARIHKWIEELKKHHDTIKNNQRN